MYFSLNGKKHLSKHAQWPAWSCLPIYWAAVSNSERRTEEGKPNKLEGEGKDEKTPLDLSILLLTGMPEQGQTSLWEEQD